MRRRHTFHLALVTAASSSLVLAAAAPSSAGGADRKSYKTAAASVGAVETRLGSLELVDYLSGTYYDRIIGSASRTETVAVTVPGDGGVTTRTSCKDASVSFYGQTTDWSNVAGSQGARLVLACTYPNGDKHRFLWGVRSGADATLQERTNCLELTRSTGSSTTTYAARTPSNGTCTAQDEILDKAGKQAASREDLQMPFDITFTVNGLVPLQ